jgi:Family of unknown function (DUF5946)
MTVTGLVSCVGCGALVPDIDGPTHRYIGASPGCWAIYTDLGAGGLPATPLSAMAVDAYAVQHPGTPGPQSTPSVWVHLITLQLVLEAGWPTSQAIRLRAAAADAFGRWPWLEPPASRGAVTVVDVVQTAERDVSVVDGYVRGAWDAWRDHHPAVRSRALTIVSS